MAFYGNVITFIPVIEDIPAVVVIVRIHEGFIRSSALQRLDIIQFHFREVVGIAFGGEGSGSQKSGGYDGFSNVGVGSEEEVDAMAWMER